MVSDEKVIKTGVDFGGSKSKFRFSNTEVCCTDPKTGKQSAWKVCDVCGREQKSNNGFEIEYQSQAAWGFSRHGYCARCANRLIPILEDALNEVHRKEQEIRNAAFPAQSHLGTEDVQTADQVLSDALTTSMLYI